MSAAVIGVEVVTTVGIEIPCGPERNATDGMTDQLTSSPHHFGGSASDLHLKSSHHDGTGLAGTVDPT